MPLLAFYSKLIPMGAYSRDLHVPLFRCPVRLASRGKLSSLYLLAIYACLVVDDRGRQIRIGTDTYCAGRRRLSRKNGSV